MNEPTRSIRELPATESRIETGPIRFGEDWPGTFIRGDHAASYAVHLEAMLMAFPITGISLAVLRGLLSDLQSSNLFDSPRQST